MYYLMVQEILFNTHNSASMSVCFSSHSSILYSYGDVTITGEGLQIFYLCSALMAQEKWGFFNLPHIRWHGAFVYNGDLRGPVTLTPVAERLTVEKSLLVPTTLDCRVGIHEKRGESILSNNKLVYDLESIHIACS